MLLDIGSVLGGIGLAVVGFIVVVLVCVVILRLLAAILPSYEDRDGQAPEPEADPETGGDEVHDAEAQDAEAHDGEAARTSEGPTEASSEADHSE